MAAIAFNPSLAFCNSSIDCCKRFSRVGKFAVNFHLIGHEQYRFRAVFVSVGDFASHRGELRIGRAVENAFLVVLLRFMSNDNDGLALDVDSRVVVVLQLRRRDAVPDEYQWQIELCRAADALGCKIGVQFEIGVRWFVAVIGSSAQ